MLAFKPPAGAGLPEPAIGGDEVYLVPQRDQLLVGATVERVGFDSSLTEKASSWLLAKSVALMPCLKDWPIVDHWAGLRPGSPDDLPILGQTALPGLFVASGQYRNGILYAPAVAEALSAMITGEKVPQYFSAFDPCRFAANTFHAGEYAE
jgi:glycine/D-amino acid oxidase-like deaminating enzyme